MSELSDPLKLRVVMGSCERRGVWKVPSRVEAHVSFGNMELDLREAELGPDTTIDANVYMGNLEIIVPDDLAVRALADALRRGVSVEIIVPGQHTDSEIVRQASRALWGDLLAAGADIYEYRPTMYHCKVMIVDEAWVSVGSTNFDERSFRLNDEANLNVYDPVFAMEQVVNFDRDKAASRRVTLEQWLQRPWTEKLLERLTSLLRSQL